MSLDPAAVEEVAPRPHPSHTRHLSLDPEQLKRVADAAVAVQLTSENTVAQRNSQLSLTGSQHSNSSLTSPVLRRWSQHGGLGEAEQPSPTPPASGAVEAEVEKPLVLLRRKSGWATLRNKFSNFVRRHSVGHGSTHSLPVEALKEETQLEEAQAIETLSEETTPEEETPEVSTPPEVVTPLEVVTPPEVATPPEERRQHRQSSIVSSDSQWSFKSALSAQELRSDSDQFDDAMGGSIDHVHTVPEEIQADEPSSPTTLINNTPTDPPLSVTIPQTYVTQPSTSNSMTGVADVTVTQDDAPDEVPSTIEFVDLHGQLNQPITRSPLLMSCYKSHMTKLQCAHWAAHPPRKSGFSEAKTDYADPVLHASWIPHFAYTKEGFTPALMIEKEEHDDLPEPPNVPAPTTADAMRTSFFSDPRTPADAGNNC